MRSLCVAGIACSLIASCAATPPAPQRQAARHRDSVGTHERPASADVPAGPADLPAFCTSHPCRRDVTIRLHKTDGSVFEEHKDFMQPPVQDTVVTVLPGETVRFVPVWKDGAFDHWREPDGSDAPGAQVFSVKLEEADEHKGTMMGVITNSGAHAAKLRLEMMRLDDDASHYTSSCPIMPGKTSFELWPEPVFTLVVTSAEILGPDAKMVCD